MVVFTNGMSMTSS